VLKAPVGALGAAGVLLILAALLGFWEDGLVAGPMLLLIAYAVALAVSHHALDPAAPLLAAGFLALVDLGSWSLELSESRETPPLYHLRTLLVLTLGALGTSAAILAAGDLGSGGGIVLWLLGAAAVAAIFTTIRPTGRSEPSRRQLER
jgi:hypothetical protein